MASIVGFVIDCKVQVCKSVHINVQKCNKFTSYFSFCEVLCNVIMITYIFAHLLHVDGLIVMI